MLFRDQSNTNEKLVRETQQERKRKEVINLGILHDSKFTFKPHGKQMISKVIAITLHLRRVVEKNWDLILKFSTDLFYSNYTK